MTEWVILQYLICEYLICYFIYYFICLFFEHRPANSQALEWDSLIISPSHSQALVKHCPNLQKILVFPLLFAPKQKTFWPRQTGFLLPKASKFLPQTQNSLPQNWVSSNCSILGLAGLFEQQITTVVFDWYDVGFFYYMFVFHLSGEVILLNWFEIGSEQTEAYQLSVSSMLESW